MSSDINNKNPLLNKGASIINRATKIILLVVSLGILAAISTGMVFYDEPSNSYCEKTIDQKGF